MAELSGGKRLDETAVRLEGSTLAARVAHGEKILASTSEAFAASLRPWALIEDVEALALRSFTRAAPASRQHNARRALASLLKNEDRVLRALTLHMLEGHAPEFFASENLAAVLAREVSQLQSTQLFPEWLSPNDAMTRLDALYVLHERGEKIFVDGAQLSRCIQAVSASSELHAWLLGELAHQLNLPGRTSLGERHFRQTHRLSDLYQLTHLFLLATRYLHSPLPRVGFESMTEELLLATAHVLSQHELDLAAEISFCLQLAGESRASERSQILEALAREQSDDGSVGDEHCTAAALLAFATAL
jgi:D-amino peptidase